MAFSAIVRKSASSLGPLASRLALVQRKYHSALFSAINRDNLYHKSTLSPFLPSFNYSSAASATNKPSSDESLAQVIDSEIKCALETDGQDRIEEIPSGFPFKIEDQPGHQSVTLTREYQGELIKVEVLMPNLVTGEDDEDLDDEADDQKASQSSVPLVVTVSKKNGPSLEFNCTAFADEIAIDSLSTRSPENTEDQIAYEGPDFHDLDENLQKAFHKYLEIRGIKPSTTNFLHEYMINKESREYLLWLKNLKGFVEA
ncbi:MAM33 domain-containing protein [Cephalotus follicularis]|uniref:MAM33 domain-containing protein n=1 Tax=Cephalotus follicularis TaxID=3775 RepID=A0A1Q3BRG9_CEPFO|nr:MAM33 domain-containing protein [Cephalotus follicularis]